MPTKLKLSINVAGMTAGEYKATVRLTVAEAFCPTLEIPVVLTVADLHPAARID